MNIGALEATLGIDSSGLRKAEGDLRQFGSTANSTFGSAGSAASSCASQLAAVAGVTLSIVGAFSLAQKAVSSWYSLISGGISIVDDYQKKIISTSYILTTMSDVKPPDLAKAYGEWKGYFDWLYRESLRVDKMAAASGQDIFNVSIEMAKKGVVAASEEEMNTIGRLTDLMKAVTPGYMNFEQQARGEIMAMMEGTARMGAQTAQILSQIDPEFKKNIASAREQGTVLKYIESILPQIKQYTLDLMGTWDAVGSSLKSAWSVINLSAFGDAHKEVVALATELGNRLVDNGRLTADGEKAAKALGEAWNMARDYITEAMDYILNNSDTIVSKIETIVSVMGKITGIAIDIGIGFLSIIDSVSQFAMNVQVGMVNVRAAIGYTIDWFQIMGTAIKDVTVAIIMNFSDVAPAVAQAYASMGVSSAYWANAAIQDANAVRGAVLGAMQATRNVPPALQGIFGTPLPTAIAPPPGPTAAPNVPGIRPFTGKEPKGGGGSKGAGGGGGADAEINRLNSLFDTLTKDIARLSEGKLSAIEADYVKTVENIFKKTSDRVHSEAEVEILAKTRATLQKSKLQDDFDLKMSKGSGDAFIEINEQYKKDLLDYNGLAGAKEKIDTYYGRQRVIKETERVSEVLNLQKTYVDAMASASPIISDQLTWKKQSLDIENKLAQAAITKMMAEKPYLAHLEDELRLHQALVAQAKKYALAREGWMTEGIGGGLKAGSIERDKESATRTAQWTIDAMKGAEQQLGEMGGQAFVDYLHGKKMDLTKMFQDLGDSLIKQVFKMATTKLFDSIWSGVGKALGLDNKGKPDGSSGNPFHVTFEGLGAKGIGGLGGGGTPDFATKASKIGYTLGGGGATSGKLGGYESVAGIKSLEKEYNKYFKLRTKGEKKMDKTGDKQWKEDIKQETKLTKLETKNFQKEYDQFGLLQTYKDTDLQTSLTNNQLNQDSFVAAQQAKMAQSQMFYTTESTSQQGYFAEATSVVNGIADVFLVGQAIMTAAGIKGDAQRIMSFAGMATKAMGMIMKLAKGSILADAYRGAAGAYAALAGIPYVGPALGAVAAVVAFAAISAYGALGGVTKNIASSAGGDYQVGGTGPRYVHQDETILPVWAANSWRDIVSREATGGRPGENGGAPTSVIYSPTYYINAIDAKGVDKVLEKHGRTMTKIINREIGRRGRHI